MTADQAPTRARRLLVAHLMALRRATGGTVSWFEHYELCGILDLTIQAAVDRAVALCREPVEDQVVASRRDHLAATAAAHRLLFVAESLAESDDIGAFPVEYRGGPRGKIEVHAVGPGGEGRSSVTTEPTASAGVP